jgi:hypothetical protein
MTHFVIPEAANGSRECALDDKLRGCRESILPVVVMDFGFVLCDAPE